jgi:2'-5' RNA ligase
MRLFVALDISPDIHERIHDYVERLKREMPDLPAKWARPEGWHITLKFIGETERMEEIKRALATVAAAPFELTFRGFGFFTARSPRVFYVDVHASAALPDLARQVDQATSKAGIPTETAKYSPHLTLARFGSGRPQGAASDRNRRKMYTLKALIEARPDLRNIEFGRMTANEFFLYQSVLHPKGAQYTKLASYKLA